LVVRITTASSTKDWLAPRWAGGTLIDLPEPVPAHVFVLDPTTCAILLEGDLPMRSVAISIDADLKSGKLSLSIVGKDLASGYSPAFELTDLCSASPSPTATP
jgi:hypothetical protein